MTTATLIDNGLLKASLHEAFCLRPERAQELVDAIVEGRVVFPREALQLGSFKNELARKAITATWLSGCMPADWTDVIGYSVRLKVRSLQWLPEEGVLKVEHA